jgi:hypothetical protein
MSSERDLQRLSTSGPSPAIGSPRESAPRRWGGVGPWLVLGLLGLFALHQDFWNWQRSELVMGLPVGLLYHFLYCFAVAIYMALLLRLSPPVEPPS